MNEDNKPIKTLEEEESEALIEDMEYEEQQGKKTKKRLREKITTRNIVILILLIIIIILLLRGCSSDVMMEIFTKPEIETESYTEQESNERSRKDHIAVYTLMDGYVNEDSPYITLRASKENFRKFYVMFEIYVDGNDVLSYATDLIDVKKDEDFKVLVNMYDLLHGEIGNHEVAVRVKAYDYDNLQPASSTIQKITISVS